MTPDQIFELALSFTIGKNVEGGYVVDQGGPTNHGVTQANYGFWLVGKGLPDANVVNITAEQVHDFYRDRFWIIDPRSPQLSQLATFVPLTTIAVFDFGVNAYWRRSITTLQSMSHVVEDGVIGPGTCHATHVTRDLVGGDLPLAIKFNQLRRSYYRSLAKGKPEEFEVDLNGWLNRCDNLDKYISTLHLI